MSLIGRGLNALGAAVGDPAEDAPGEVAGRIRARQVDAVVRLTPVMMGANVLNALAVALVFLLVGEPMGPVLLWSAAACGAAAWFSVGWLRRRGRPFPQELGPATSRKVVANAAALALVWAVPSLALMPGAAPLAQAFLLVIAAGMVSGGVACFYPIPRAAAAYSAILVAAAIVGVAQASLPILIGGLLVAASYFLVFRRLIARHAEVFVSEIAARAELEEKTERIETLMATTEAEANRIAGESMRRLEQAQKMEALGQLTGGMAHDFNNLLSVVRGNADLQLELDHVDRELIGEIVTATERGADLIQKLLAYSRRQALRPELVDARAALAEAADVLRRILGETVSVETDCADDGWPVRADRVQLQAALINLALNARDAMPEGGRLTIGCRERSVTDGEARELGGRLGYGVTPGRYVALEVRDNGCGMSPATAARVFEPFFTTKPPGKGTGLGLSMVLGFIRQSGGFVTLRTAPGAGAAFTLHLAEAEATEAPPSAARAEDAPRGRGETILLIEDRDDVRRTVGAMLGALGYKVAAAGDVEAAEALLAGGLAPSLVISDVVLPGGVSGVDFARRHAARTPETPVLLMSGFAGDRDDDREAASLGRPMLKKPFSRQALANAIDEALRR